ncbi:MAG: hypothetical protein JST93_25405 [Acidobacteria bacterium]|nr:hypothetical protein [Acidobacteriota bacterium]
MHFDEATAKFQHFLGEQGHPGPLLWIAPQDVSWWGFKPLLRIRPEAERESVTLFDQAVQRGFGVALIAVFQSNHSICCMVVAPEDADDAANRFIAPPLTMKVRENLRMVEEASALRWWLSKRLFPSRDFTV